MKGKTLHELVKSLTKSEKRYLKRLAEFGSGRKKSATTRLFDLLDAMPAYDPARLGREWDDNASQIHVVQTRLFDLILKSLRMARSEEDLDWHLGKIIADVGILFEKKLYNECQRRIVKGKKLCIAHGKYDFLLRFYGWEYKIQLLMSQTGLLDEMRGLQQERLEVANKLHEMQRAEVAEGMSRILLRAAGQGTPPQWHEELENHLATFEQGGPDPESSFQAWSFWKRACGNAAYLEGNYREASGMFGEILSELETRPEWLDRFASEYLSVFNNFLNCCLLAGEYEEFASGISQIRDLSFKRTSVKIQFEFQALLQELQFSINLKEHEDSLPVVERLKVWLGANRDEVPISKFLVACFNAFSLHFVHGEFRQANDWLLEILSTPGKEERRDIRDVARIFQVILHHELGNPDLQDYLLASSYRYFRRKDRLGELNAALIRFFRAEQRYLPETEEFRNALQELDSETEDVIRTGAGKIPLGMTEVSFWVKSKLEGIPLREFYEKMVAAQRAGKLR